MVMDHLGRTTCKRFCMGQRKRTHSSTHVLSSNVGYDDGVFDRRWRGILPNDANCYYCQSHPTVNEVRKSGVLWLVL